VLTFIQRDLLDGLRSRGFQLNYGIHDTGPGLLVWSKGGGYYFGAYHYPLASNIYSESVVHRDGGFSAYRGWKDKAEKRATDREVYRTCDTV
jgi:hypothetical protein